MAAAAATASSSTASCNVANIATWDVSKVTNMVALFGNPGDNYQVGTSNPSRDFNADLSRWDVSSVTAMTGLFSGAASFNSDLSSWMRQ